MSTPISGKPTPVSGEDRLWFHSLQGDRNSFESIFKRYYIQLYNYGRKIYNDDVIVRDSIQDLFLYIWEKKNHLSRVESVKAYLLTSLRREIIKKVRKKKKASRNLRYLKNKSVAEFQLTYQDFMVSKEIKRESHDKMIRALNELPPQKKEVIYLRFYNGMDFQEIAMIMELDEQTIHNYLYLALSRLRNVLVDESAVAG